MLYKMSCQRCGGRVSFEDGAVGTTVECPHCHEPLALVVPTSSENAPEAASARKSGKRWLMVSLGGLGIVLLAGLALGCVYVFQQGPPPVSGPGFAVVSGEKLTVDAPEGEIRDVRIRKRGNCEVTLHKSFPLATVWYCDVSFKKGKPAPAEVDETVRASLEKCIKYGPSQQIVAIAFMSNQPLAKTEYSGPLVWNPEEKAIQLWGGTTAGKASPGQAQ